MLIAYSFHTTLFGPCMIGLTDNKLCYLAFITQNQQTAIEQLQKSWPNAQLAGDTKTQEKFCNLSVLKNKFELLLEGTDFQKKVWNSLRKIPQGTTISYQELAQKIGKPKAHRAVASAVAKNRIAYFIPCHRVIKKSGEIGDYRWGVACKQTLLAHEKRGKNEASY